MTNSTKYTAVLWSWYNGSWYRVNAARPARPARKDSRGTIPAVAEVTDEDLQQDLIHRRTVAQKHGSRAIFTITMDGRTPPPPR